MLGGFADTVKESTITVMNQALGWVEQAVFVNQTLLRFLPWNSLSGFSPFWSRISQEYPEEEEIIVGLMEHQESGTIWESVEQC